MDKLDEKSLRRPDWRDGHAVTLLDGQAWTFPAPTLRFRRVRVGEGPRSLGLLAVHAQEYGERFRALQAALEAGDSNASILLQLELAASLIQRNYDLTDDQVDDLIQFSWTEGDTEAVEMTRALQALVMGGTPDPKGEPSTSGGDPA